MYINLFCVLIKGTNTCNCLSQQVVPQFEIAIVGERLYELGSQKYQKKNVAGG